MSPWLNILIVTGCDRRRVVPLALAASVLVVTAACRRSGPGRHDDYRSGSASASGRYYDDADTVEGSPDSVGVGDHASQYSHRAPLPPTWARRRDVHASRRADARESRRRRADRSQRRSSKTGVGGQRMKHAGRNDAPPPDGANNQYAQGDEPGDAIDDYLPSEPPPLGRLPTLSSDYTIMLAVFLAPLLALVPIVYLWHVARKYLAAT